MQGFAVHWRSHRVQRKWVNKEGCHLMWRLFFVIEYSITNLKGADGIQLFLDVDHRMRIPVTSPTNIPLPINRISGLSRKANAFLVVLQDFS